MALPSRRCAAARRRRRRRRRGRRAGCGRRGRRPGLRARQLELRLDRELHDVGLRLPTRPAVEDLDGPGEVARALEVARRSPRAPSATSSGRRASRPSRPAPSSVSQRRSGSARLISSSMRTGPALPLAQFLDQRDALLQLLLALLEVLRPAAGPTCSRCCLLLRRAQLGVEARGLLAQRRRTRQPMSSSGGREDRRARGWRPSGRRGPTVFAGLRSTASRLMRIIGRPPGAARGPRRRPTVAATSSGALTPNFCGVERDAS